MPSKSAFDRYVDEQKKDPAFADEHERMGIEIRAIDDFVRLVDTARIAHGMTKADLARKVSMNPEAVRRLLTSSSANPTLETILAVLEAVGLRFCAPPAGPATHSRPETLERSRKRKIG